MVDEMENTVQTVVNPGELLRIERERVGFSADEVAAHLHLSKTTLGYLEEGRFDRLPGDTFTRGYIRSYARLLKLDPNVFASHFDRYVGADSRPVRVSSINRIVPARSGTRWMGLSTLLIIVIMLALGLWWWSDSRAPSLPPEDADVRALIDDVQVDAMIPPQHSAADEAQMDNELASDLPVETVDTVENLEEQVSPADAVPASVETSEAAVSPDPAAAEVNAGKGLHMAFSGSCWVQISAADGRVLHAAEMSAGQRVQIDHEGPLSLVIGAPQAVSTIEYNGQPVELTAHRQSGVARLSLGQ